MNIQGKTVLITGGNSGIGKETAVALAKVGANVVFTSRDAAKGAAAADVSTRAGRDVAWLPLDLASFASIRRFADDFLSRYDRLDVLVNNAGLMQQHRSETEDGFETTFGVNHLGHFLLTQLLLDRVKSSSPSRIVVVASDAHRQARSGLDFDDLQSKKRYGGLAAYGKSKLANILFTRELARRIEGSGVTANSLHPGTIATGFGADGDTTGIVAFGFSLARPFFKKPAQGAATSIYLASSPDVEGVTGKYFADCKEKQPTAAAQDDAAARRLWEVSETLVAAVQSPAGR